MFWKIFAVIPAITTIAGCAEISDRKIEEKMEYVLGHDIPDRFLVTYRYDNPGIIRLDDSWEYHIREVLRFKVDAHPYVTMQIFPDSKSLLYSRFIP